MHHGLAEDLFHPTPAPTGDYLAFLGRISPEKRPDRAIEIARRSGCRLRIAAKVDAADQIYFKEAIEPLLSDPLVEFIGEIGDDAKAEFLGNAAGLLFPIDWPEPFGLVMIEAMACGTPVIAWNCGSVPEVIDHGVSGFIVRSMDEAVEAVGRLPELDRGEIRRSFERRFSSRGDGRALSRAVWPPGRRKRHDPSPAGRRVSRPELIPEEPVPDPAPPPDASARRVPLRMYCAEARRHLPGRRRPRQHRRRR